MKEMLIEVVFPVVLICVVVVGAIFACAGLVHWAFDDAPATPAQQTIQDNQKISEAQTILLGRCMERLQWCQDICVVEKREK
jgi:hypothetical protein